MTQMVQNYSISTGATLSSNVSFNTQIALSYYNNLGNGGVYVNMSGGKVVDETVTLKNDVQVIIDEQKEEEEEVAALEAAEAAERANLLSQINSYNPPVFENGGVIKITNPIDNMFGYVKFSINSEESSDVIELVDDVSNATPVGILNERLVRGDQSAPTCFPFMRSMAYDLDSPLTSMSSLLMHPCLDSVTSNFYSKLTLGSNNSIERIGAKCFVSVDAPTPSEPGVQLGVINCGRADSLLAEIVDPETISDNFANGGMGLEEQGTGTE